VLLYYTAHPGTQHASAGASTGLAVSRDGIRFDRSPAPVVDGYAPEAVVSDGVVHLLFQREAAAGGFEVFLRTSSDGRDFSAKAEQRVFGGSGVAGAFDERSVATGRIWREGDWWVMAYAGCRRFLDYPEAVGLARSRDLRDWERYPGNPVLERGEPGTWDEGALWFPTVHVVGDTRWMFYEGCGAGLGTDTARARVTSAAVRDADYGGYDVVSFSSIGLARHTGPVAEW
jgi:hypothetical protein